jgi:hypothetical protein
MTTAAKRERRLVFMVRTSAPMREDSNAEFFLRTQAVKEKLGIAVGRN